VFGHSVREERSRVQRLVGTCPQDNLLWSELTAREHVRLYAALKGLDTDEGARVGDELLAKFTLDDVADLPVRAFSGGMQRRLCIALACIGEPRVLVLDEPSTGLDVGSRQRLWETLRELRRGRVLLLTTHSMEEADALADRVALISHGHLRALGSSLFLRNRFGSGYQVVLNTAGADAAEATVAAARELLPTAEVIERAPGRVALAVPVAALGFVDRFFEALEQRGLLGDWSVGNSTLEEVFLKLCHADEAVEEGSRGTAQPRELCQLCGTRVAAAVTVFNTFGVSVLSDRVLCYECAFRKPDGTVALPPPTAGADDGKAGAPEPPRLAATPEPAPPPPSAPPAAGDASQLPAGRPLSVCAQAVAVARKNAALLVKDRRAFSNFLQDSKMLIFRIAAVIVTLAGVTGPVAERAPVACLVYTPAGSSQPCSAAAFADALNRSLIYAQGAGYPSSYSFASWWYTDSPVAGDSPLTAFDVFGNGVGNMSGWAGGTRITLVRKTATAPQLNAATNALIEQNAQVDPAVNHCGNIPQNRAFDWFVGNMSSQQLTNFTSAFWPAYSIDIERADAAAGVLIVSLSAPPRGNMHMWSAQSTINQYCWAVRPNPYTTVGNDGAALVYLEQQLAGALGSAAPNSTDISGGVFDTSSLIAYRGGVSSWFVVVVVAAFLLLSGLVFPDAPTRIVAEREKGLEFLVRLAGVDWAGLWLGNVAFDLAIVASWSVAFTVVGLLVSSSALKFLSVGHLVLLLLAWSVAQVAMGYLFSAALASEVSASILAHLFVVVGAGLGAAVYYFSAWHPAMFLVPHFAFAHGMAALFGFTDSDDDVFVAVGALLGVGLPLLLAAVALNNPAEARAALQRCRKGRTKAAVAWPRRGARAESVSTPLLNDEEAGNTQQHAPVALSRSYGSVNSDNGEEGGGGGGEARAVLIERVSFLYPASERAPAKLALDSLSLEADYGECVGVLGPSGAGKTTLLDLMCGRLSATEGRVLVGGLDMASRPPGAALRIGFVPQRTVLFDELSTREQLATFARLRGVASAEASEAVVRVAELVQLDGDALDRRTRDLSEGMRRRLAIGVALIGGPRVLLCDEPSAALAPDARREVWAVLDTVKRTGCALILSTHAMDEAEALCARVAIIDAGRLRAVGSVAALKQRFGRSFFLTLTLARTPQPPPLDALTDAVRRLVHPAARVHASSEQAAVFEIPVVKSREAVVAFPRILQARQQLAEQFGVLEWGLSQTTLRDVFLATVQDKSA
jgi:ABC-type multidrug transport system ATPase subunit